MRVASTHCHTLLLDLGHTGRNVPEGGREVEPGQEDTCPKPRSPGVETGSGVTHSRPRASKSRRPRSSLPVTSGGVCSPTKRLKVEQGGWYALSVYTSCKEQKS